jgi:hypothetical protein
MPKIKIEIEKTPGIAADGRKTGMEKGGIGKQTGKIKAAAK